MKDLTCCNNFQLTGLIIMGSSFFMYIILWQSRILAALKLTIVSQHEFSHALACVLTGGKVKSITISSNFGGVTTTQGGNRAVTLTAGYIGSTMFGCMYLLLATTNDNSNYAGGALYCLSCLISIWVLKAEKKDSFCSTTGLRLSILMLISIFVGLFFLQFYSVWGDKRWLCYGLIVVGVGNMLFALMETVEDTCMSKISDEERGKSDAGERAKLQT